MNITRRPKNYEHDFEFQRAEQELLQNGGRVSHYFVDGREVSYDEFMNPKSDKSLFAFLGGFILGFFMGTYK